MTLPDLSGPAKVDLAIVQGARFEKGFAWNIGGARVPFIGYHAEAQIRTSSGGWQLILDLGPYLTVNTVDNDVNLNIPADVTKHILRPGDWDLFIVSNTDPADAECLAAGKVKLKSSRSR